MSVDRSQMADGRRNAMSENARSAESPDTAGRALSLFALTHIAIVSGMVGTSYAPGADQDTACCSPNNSPSTTRV